MTSLDDRTIRLDGAVEVAHEGPAHRRWLTAADELASSTFALQPSESSPEHSVLRVGPGRRIRLAVLRGADPRVALAVRRAVLAAGVEVAVTLVADPRALFGERADQLRSVAPDAVLVHGDDARGGDAIVDLVEALRAGCAAQPVAPTVIVAGMHAGRVAAAAHPFPVEAIPELRRPEALAAFVARLRELRRGDDPALVLRDEALESLAAALVRHAHGATSPVIIVDLTGGSTSLIRASTDLLVAAHVVPLGLGLAADRVVGRAGVDRVRRWIPRALDGPSILERIFNRARWPNAVAAEPLALALEIALAHEAVAQALGDAVTAFGVPAAFFRDAPRIVLTGRLADLPRPAQSLLVALDALEPRAVTAIARERCDGLVAFGAQTASARSRGGHDALRSGLELERRSEPLALVAPLATRRPAVLQVRHAGRKIDQRIEPGVLMALAISGPVEVSCVSPALRGKGDAGRLGLVIDARGRPLSLPPRDAERVPTVARWFDALEAMPGGHS